MPTLLRKVITLQFKLSIFISIFFFGCKDASISNNTITDVFKEDIINVQSLQKNVAQWAAGNAIELQKIDVNLDSVSEIKFTEYIKNLYTLNANNLIWVNEKGVTENAKQLLKIIPNLSDHGINTSVYQLENLQTLAAKISKGNAADSVIENFELAMSLAYTRSVSDLKFGNIATIEKEYYNTNDSNFSVSKYCNNLLKTDSLPFVYKNLIPSLKLYTTLMKKLSSLRTLQSAGGWPVMSGIKDSLSGGNMGKQIKLLRKRLFLEIALPKDTSAEIFDVDLGLAIKHFQYLHDMRISGFVDTATLRKLNYTVDNKIFWVSQNLERIRKLNQNFAQPYVWVNVPHMQLAYINKDSLQYKMRTVVGRTSRATPTLDAPMTNIVINPNWSVPPTIMKEEIVPGIERKGGSYLTKRGLTAYIGGRKVNPDVINEKNYRRYRIEQKPGLNSSLGAVKFNLPNVHSIYLHDTPHREDFVKHYRAYSSGCIRVEKPRDFAVFLLADTNYTKPKIDSIIKGRETRIVNLKQKLDVHIVYITNDLDSIGNVLYLRDLYGKDRLN